VTDPEKSIHRATISLDVSAKIADVLVYATGIAQRMTSDCGCSVHRTSYRLARFGWTLLWRCLCGAGTLTSVVDAARAARYPPLVLFPSFEMTSGSTAGAQSTVSTKVQLGYDPQAQL